MITIARANEISFEKLETLNPEFRTKAYLWYNTCRKQGIKVYIYEGFRSRERQSELFALGRNEDGHIVNKSKVVTYARPGESFHNYGFALDWVPLATNSKVVGMFEADWTNEVEYAKAWAVARDFSLIRLDFETPHIQDGKFDTIEKLKEFVGDKMFPYSGLQ